MAETASAYINKQIQSLALPFFELRSLFCGACKYSHMRFLFFGVRKYTHTCSLLRCMQTCTYTLSHFLNACKHYHMCLHAS